MSLLPIHKPWVFLVMRDFGFYDYNLMLVCAILGAFLGSMLSYAFGFISGFLSKNRLSNNKYVRILIVNGIFCIGWINVIGSFFCFISGYMNIKLRYVIPGMIISHLFYYLILV
ncbi:MAG: hypothetical protein HRK26_02730 [Rickettsiaceae bacterium H1]|nr:hypothetical protein [Rickettsiaceae bacterium H1]